MTHKPTRDNIYKAIGCLIDAYAYLAPDEDRNNPAFILADMKHDGSYTPILYCRQLASGIYDGLAYDFWPSVLRRMADKPHKPL